MRSVVDAAKRVNSALGHGVPFALSNTKPISKPAFKSAHNAEAKTKTFQSSRSDSFLGDSIPHQRLVCANHCVTLGASEFNNETQCLFFKANAKLKACYNYLFF